MIFEGKTVLITGASSGIGLCAAQNMAAEGANVVMVASHPEKLEEAAAEIRKQGYCAHAKVADVTKYEDVLDACRYAYETFGSLDITVSCAGGSACRIKGILDKEFKDIPMDVLDWGLDLNMKGPFYMGHAAMQYMSKQNSGVIINIGSISGEEGSHLGVDYSTAKSGIMYGFTKSLAIYAAQYGVRVCCVSPGPVLTRPAMKNMDTLLGRAAEPQEIVDMIMYLASDKAAFITGTNYLVDGGRLILRNKGNT